MKESKSLDLLKNVIYVILLFGLSAILMLTNIYCDGIAQAFAYLVIGGAAAILNVFSLIALKREKSFYAAADLLCTVLWAYPIYTKINESGLDMWVYIVSYAALLPAVLCCVTEIIGCCIKKEQAEKAKNTKKVLSVIGIVIAIAAAVLTALSAVHLNTQFTTEINNRKEAYSAAAELANQIANDYKSSDLIIEEVLDKYQLTYDHTEENYYIIEELNSIHMTIDTSAEEGKNVISVSSDGIGWGISRLFEVSIYDAQNEQISLK